MTAPTPDASTPRTGFPRLTASLAAVRHNTAVLTDHLLAKGIELVGVTKAVDGEPEPFPEELGHELDQIIAAAYAAS